MRRDNFQYRQGRQYALEALSAAKSTLSEKNLFASLLANLRSTCANKPKSFADGIMSIVQEADLLQ